MRFELVVATRNKDKLKEIQSLLSDLPIKVLSLKDFSDIAEIKESGLSFQENAMIKARTCARMTKRLSLADDSGLEVEVLKGLPGVYSARFAGKKVSYQDNNKKLLYLLKGVPYTKRKARFSCCIAIVEPSGKLIRTVKGTCSGKIAFMERGKYGFGYDPVFIPRGYKKTFAELGEAVKNKISHRARALKKAKKIILKYLQRNLQLPQG